MSGGYWKSRFQLMFADFVTYFRDTSGDCDCTRAIAEIRVPKDSSCDAHSNGAKQQSRRRVHDQRTRETVRKMTPEIAFPPSETTFPALENRLPAKTS